MIRINLLSLYILLCFYSFIEAVNINELSLEQKVGQLFIVHFHGKEANAEAEELIKKAYVGGFIYYTFCNELGVPEQVRQLSEGLQTLAKGNIPPIPLWISVDQEGGPVVRLKEGFSLIPGNRELGKTGQPMKAREWAFQVGKELGGVGINMNLAPVVDISSHPEKSFMAQRTYGETPEIVTSFAQQALEGYHLSNVMPVLKHFPGYGSVEKERDPHYHLPITNKTRLELEELDWIPFKKLLREADGIMSAHILVPELDPHHCATLSPLIIKKILREEWQYDGLILSDSLTMRGLLEKDNITIEEAAIQTILAGCDLIIIGRKQLQDGGGCEVHLSDTLSIIQAVFRAAQEGRIPLEQIDASVNRILRFKEKYK